MHRARSRDDARGLLGNLCREEVARRMHARCRRERSLQGRRGTDHIGRHIDAPGTRRARELLRRSALRQPLRVLHRVHVPAARGGKRPKNLQIFSCNSLIGTSNRFGRCYDKRRARGMRHSNAHKAVARKILKVIYAIMRNGVPYAA